MEQSKIEEKRRRKVIGVILKLSSGHSIYWFACKCDMHPSTIYDMMKKEKPSNPTIRMRDKIMIAFNVDIFSDIDGK